MKNTFLYGFTETSTGLSQVPDLLQLIAHTGEGVINPNFISISKNKDPFDANQNVMMIAQALTTIIAHRDTPPMINSEHVPQEFAHV